jgi:putative glutamine transport system substrate-binding protein
MRKPWRRSLVWFSILALLVSACRETTNTPVGGGDAGIPKAAEGTLLREIQDRGKIVIGVKYDVPTFGYLNPVTNRLEGFDVDIGHAIAEYIFGDPNAVEYKEAVADNRVRHLNDGTVDVILSTMAINAERLREIDFSVVYYVAGQTLLVPKNSPIKGVADLNEKKVGTIRDSVSEANIRVRAPEAEISLFDSHAHAVNAMANGQVDAVTTDDAILYGYERRAPDRWQVVGGQFTQEPYGAGVAKGNQELLDVVNTVIRAMKADGRWTTLYKTWLSETDVPSPPPDDWQQVK